MVKSSRTGLEACATALRRLAGGVRQDMERCAGRLTALTRPLPGPGLYSYRLRRGADQLHLHLRLHLDRSALLFVNGVETYHLPPSMAEMLKLHLDGASRERALARLTFAYPEVPPATVAQDLERVSQLLHRLWQPGPDCPWCELGLPQPAPFSVRAQAPYKADVALHYLCNNHCAHCYNEPGRRQASLSLEDWKRTLNRLWDIGVPYVIFTGGEPTLHPHLTELVAHASALGQITGLNSNGRLLAEPELPATLLQAGLDHVQITLHSDLPEVHDNLVSAPAWEETVAGIRACLELGLHTLTNTTLLAANAGRAVEMVEFLHTLGLRTFAMNGIIRSGCGAYYPGGLRESQVLPLLERVQERAAELDMKFLWYTPTRYCRLSPVELGVGPKACNAAEYSICVEPNGSVLPCQSYYEPVGNLLTDPWENIWNSPLFLRIRNRREHPREADLPRRCVECEELEICGGGCMLELHKEETKPYAVGDRQAQ